MKRTRPLSSGFLRPPLAPRPIAATAVASRQTAESPLSRLATFAVFSRLRSPFLIWSLAGPPRHPLGRFGGESIREQGGMLMRLRLLFYHGIACHHGWTSSGPTKRDEAANVRSGEKFSGRMRDRSAGGESWCLYFSFPRPPLISNAGFLEGLAAQRQLVEDANRTSG
jgi:hypothetical protein